MVNIEVLLTFGSDNSLRPVVRRTKAILAADESFFSENSRHQRVSGPDRQQIAIRQFVKDVLVREPSNSLTVKDCFEAFLAYCKVQGIEPMDRCWFKGSVHELVKEEHKLGIRHVVLSPWNTKTHG